MNWLVVEIETCKMSNCKSTYNFFSLRLFKKQTKLSLVYHEQVGYAYCKYT